MSFHYSRSFTPSLLFVGVHDVHIYSETIPNSALHPFVSLINHRASRRVARLLPYSPRQAVPACGTCNLLGKIAGSELILHKRMGEPRSVGNAVYYSRMQTRGREDPCARRGSGDFIVLRGKSMGPNENYNWWTARDLDSLLKSSPGKGTLFE